VTRRRRTQPLPAPRIELTPLIDVTFLILVFFLFTIRFRTLEGKLESHLPREVGQRASHALEPERARVVVRVLEPGTRLDPVLDRAWSGSGPWRWGPDRVLGYDAGPRKTTRLADVAAWLGGVRALAPEVEVVVDAREDTSYADVVGVVDAARTLGCASITFAAAR
jgi:biopolymer transport protein ExbD